MNEHSPTSDINNRETASAELQSSEETPPNAVNQGGGGGESNSINNNTGSIDDDAGADADADAGADADADADAGSAMTEINIAPSPTSSTNYGRGFFLNDNRVPGHRLWTNEERAAYEERRREALSTELTRVQRTNFFHFLLLCLVPMGLIGLVLLNSFRKDSGCEGFGTVQCERERRDFRNAFSNKCICTSFQLEG